MTTSLLSCSQPSCLLSRHWFSRLLFITSISTILVFTQLAHGGQRQHSAFDGPYISFAKDLTQTQWICNGKPFKHVENQIAFPIEFDECRQSLKLFNNLATAPKAVEFSGNYKIAALSDVHGQFDVFKQVLLNGKIIDKDGNWRFGNGHLVITGDILDRGDKVNEALWFVYQLEHQARLAGGDVHFLLGNHEVMVLNGKLKYVNEKYFQSARLLDTNVRALYGRNTLLGLWMRSKPAVIKINDNLFMHGGISPMMSKAKLPLTKINDIFRENLVIGEIKRKRNRQAKLIHGKNGVLWYRGYFKSSGATMKDIDEILAQYNASRIIVGHTSQDLILSKFANKVIAIDSSIKRGKQGEILLIDDGVYSRVSFDGQRHTLFNTRQAH